jgi:hypothetical protein
MQTTGQRTPPPRFLKLFLAVNLAVLTGFFIWELGEWEIGGSAIPSEEELRKSGERAQEDVRAALAKNQPSRDLTGALGENMRHTIDATASNKWAHFSFSKGVVFYSEKIASDSLDWDLAFRRAKIISNGGATNPSGKGAVAVIGTDSFDSVTSVPQSGLFHADRIEGNPSEPKNPALDKWYKYDFWTHRLKPKEQVLAIRTADGHYAKLVILDYYCGDAAACYTVRYTYQGKDSASFAR